MSTPVLDVAGLAYAYPDGHQALYGVDLHVRVRHRGKHGQAVVVRAQVQHALRLVRKPRVGCESKPHTIAQSPEVNPNRRMASLASA